VSAVDGILVDHGSLEEMVREMRLHVEAMHERLDRLGRDLAGLHEGFEGVAKQAYVEAKARWDAHFLELGAALAAAAGAVRAADAGYAAADAHGARLFHGVRS